MSIVSAKYLIFIAIALVTYYICMPKWRWGVLLVASIGFFLANSSPALLGVFAAMTLVTWLAAIVISHISTDRTKTLITAAVVVTLVVILFMYKEVGFLVVNSVKLEKLTGLPIGLKMPTWIAPLAISYYTFILVGYLLDVRWGTIVEPQKNPLKMLLFAGYFPQMVSGPFSSYNFMQSKLFSGEKFSFRNLWNGIQRIIWGLFKVLVLSTRLSVLVAAIFSAQFLPENTLKGVGLVIGAILYVLFVYMNFSGSMDIVIGVSELFGIPLAENFQRPFSAKNLSEVWRKWHITLGLWMKTYILYPALKSNWMNRIRIAIKAKCGKKAAKNIPTYIGMFLTWLCVGFWHGGSWKFICGSGLFFFVMILGGLLLEPFFQWLIRILRIHTESKLWNLFQRIRTFLLFALSVSFGRMGSLMEGLHAWKNALLHPNWHGIFDFNAIAAYLTTYMGLNTADLTMMLGIAFGGLLFVFFISHLQEKHGEIRDIPGRRAFIIRTVIIIIIAVVSFYFGSFDNKVDFLYGTF